MTNARPPLPEDAIWLAGFALSEANSPLLRFTPGWFNVWEAALYNKALARSGGRHWLFRRFGTESDVLAGEALRKASYRAWLNSMSETCARAVSHCGSRGDFRLRHERNALIYADSWGESSTFEGVNSWRDALSVDILPKNIVRDYAIRHFTCKLRGERNGLLAALRVAQDCLNSDMADNVIICGIFRSFPALTFSEMQRYPAPGYPRRALADCQVSVERTGCLILRKTPGPGITLRLSRYQTLPSAPRPAAAQLAALWRSHLDADSREVLSVAPPALTMHEIQRRALAALPGGVGGVALADIYGDSGCMNPALAWQHQLRSAARPGHRLLSVLDGKGVWLLDNWLQESA